ncbi:hypothetical protein QYE76_071486 [Lolium multiflorum]|uniref:Uncharacterized protein n=1 Tax=Lolium multiflorum TaxID=4521 RepID=A0AAD8SLP0_LOLMU|nr:hypothetical protein QYE76_071486 [Lolium multiflorum]
MGKPRDTKIAILPSTTRKGTTLSTSAALDSPSVISKLVSPPQASNAGTSAESENSSYNCDDASAVLDNDGSLGSFLDATIARSRQIENTETPNENAATPVNSPESVEYSSDDLDEDYVELDDDFIEKCNATTDARKIKKLLAEHAVRYKLSPDPKFATSPINIKDKDYDFSLDLSHIAIVEKTPFCGKELQTIEELLAKIGRNHDDWSTPEPTPTPILKKRGMIKLNDEDMREAKKSLKEKGIKPEDVKNLPPIEDICEIIPPSSMIEDPLYPEGHPKRVEQDSQRTKTSASFKKKKKKHKNVVESSEPVNDPNSISISDAETENGNEHDKDNDKDDTPDKEEVEEEPEKHAKNKKYTKEDFIAEKHEEEDEEIQIWRIVQERNNQHRRPSRASTQIRRSYNEDIIAPSFAPEEDNGAPNASSFPCYDFLTNAGILDDFFTLVNRAGLATYVGDEREQYYMLTKIFVESFKFHNTQYEPTVAFKIYGNPVTMELEEFCRALDIAPVDNMVYRMLFADGDEKEIPLPQPGLFNIDRQSWSLTKEEVEEHMKIQDFHQQHDSEDAEPSYDCTVTYPDVSSSTYLEPGRSSSYYGDTTSWGPWE